MTFWTVTKRSCSTWRKWNGRKIAMYKVVSQRRSRPKKTRMAMMTKRWVKKRMSPWKRNKVTRNHPNRVLKMTLTVMQKATVSIRFAISSNLQLPKTTKMILKTTTRKWKKRKKALRRSKVNPRISNQSSRESK